MGLRYLLTIVLVMLATAAAGGCAVRKSNADWASEALSRGLQAHGQGRVEEAAGAYREVLRYDPANKYAFYNLGVLDQSAGRNVAAENNFRLSISSDPNYVPALYNLAILRTAAGAVPEAIDLYRQAISIEPNNPALHLNLGFALRSIGQQQEGDAAIRQAQDLRAASSQPAPGGAAPAP
jgi:tetratricopeptide (TPR) repeat protein